MSVELPRPVLARLFRYTHQPENLVRMSLVCKRWKAIADIVSQNLLREHFGMEVERNLARHKICQMTYIFNEVLEKNKNLAVVKQVPALESIFDLLKIRTVFHHQLTDKSQPKGLKVWAFNFILNDFEKQFPKNPSAQLAKTALIRTCGNLYLAAKQKNYETAEYFLENFEMNPEEIQQAFLPACSSGSYRMVKLFIEHRVNVIAQRTETEKETYLTAACKSGNLAVVKLLVGKGANTRAANAQNEIPLALAAKTNYLMFHIFSQISPTLSNTYGPEDNSIPHFAAQSKKDTSQVILDCISGDTQIDRPNLHNVTPLMLAIKMGNFKVFETLLECGADIEARCNMGWSPMHYAIYFNQEKFLQMICNQGPNRRLRLIALKFAAECRNLRAVSILTGSFGINKAVTLLGAGALAYLAYLRNQDGE